MQKWHNVAWFPALRETTSAFDKLVGGEGGKRYDLFLPQVAACAFSLKLPGNVSKDGAQL